MSAKLLQLSMLGMALAASSSITVTDTKVHISFTATEAVSASYESTSTTTRYVTMSTTPTSTSTTTRLVSYLKPPTTTMLLSPSTFTDIATALVTPPTSTFRVTPLPATTTSTTFLAQSPLTTTLTTSFTRPASSVTVMEPFTMSASASISIHAVAHNDVPEETVEPEDNEEDDEEKTEKVYYLYPGDEEKVKSDEINFSCGFTVNSSSSSDYALFTDYSEVDFLHATSLDETDWEAVVDNFTCMHSSLDNVQTNPLRDENVWSGVGENWGFPGLQLIAKPRDNDTTPVRPEAFVRTDRDDIMYGSFRAVMKNVHAPGTWLSFGWVSSDHSDSASTQMIGFNIPAAVQESSTVTLLTGDVELTDRCGMSSAVNMLDAHVHTISGDDSRMHEYRFDWTPERMDYYIDGHWLSSTEGIQPHSGGAIEIALWSNVDSTIGSVLSQEEIVTVTYAKLYFNTTDMNSTDTGAKWGSGECGAWDLGSDTETIPTEYFDESYAGQPTFFFSKMGTHDDKALEHTDSTLHFEDNPASEGAGNQQRSSLVLVTVMSAMAGLVALMV